MMTIAEIKASADAPKHVAAWACYERDHAAWKIEWDALRREIEGPAEDHASEALDAYCEAFDAVVAYAVRTPQQLCEKIEIIASDYAGFEVPLERLAAILADVRRLSKLEA
ncbi:hypothetical protein [Sphingomonas sp. GC_Shp_3]|uniref:hypothetical protein n=1 Tax=Sphingomonas sp. GC_Shp_3 TaxID=2937383 RepID=UPI002269BDB9|nr:hypothetical protein [Sphingomonas sp. GC_Shp_3]